VVGEYFRVARATAEIYRRFSDDRKISRTPWIKSHG